MRAPFSLPYFRTTGSTRERSIGSAINSSMFVATVSARCCQAQVHPLYVFCTWFTRLKISQVANSFNREKWLRRGGGSGVLAREPYKDDSLDIRCTAGCFNGRIGPDRSSAWLRPVVLMQRIKPVTWSKAPDTSSLSGRFALFHLPSTC